MAVGVARVLWPYVGVSIVADTSSRVTWDMLRTRMVIIDPVVLVASGRRRQAGMI